MRGRKNPLTPDGAVRKLMEKQNSSLKQKTGKIEYALIPPHAIEGMAQAFMDGAKKYAPGNWKLLGIEDLLEAVMRHVLAIRKGEAMASDSKLQHAAHMMAGSAMIYELIRMELGGEDVGPTPTQEQAEQFFYTNAERLEKLLAEREEGGQNAGNNQEDLPDLPQDS